jgi:hypothetical protein
MPIRLPTVLCLLADPFPAIASEKIDPGINATLFGGDLIRFVLSLYIGRDSEQSDSFVDTKKLGSAERISAMKFVNWTVGESQSWLTFESDTTEDNWWQCLPGQIAPPTASSPSRSRHSRCVRSALIAVD